MLSVHILQRIGEAHYALRVAAVTQAKGMSQFVDGLFDGAFLKERPIGNETVELLSQARQCDYSFSSGDVRLAEDEIEL